MREKRAVSLALITALLCSALTGCGNEENGKSVDLQEAQKGKFVQEEEALPDEWNGWSAKQLFVSEEELHLLMAKAEGENLSLQEWAYRNGTFENVTEEWLGEVMLPAQEWMDVKLLESGSTQYLFANFVEEGEESYQGHLWRSDGDAAKDITPKKWSTYYEDWGCYDIVRGIAALDNGTLAVYSAKFFDILFGEDGSVLQSEENTGYDYGDSILSDGKNLYLTALDNSGSATAVEKWNEGKSENAETIPIGESSTVGMNLCVTRDGTLILAGADGIFRCKAGESDWEKLMTGQETDFSLSGCWCVGLAALEDGSIYALFKQGDGSISLKRYWYDPEAVSEVTQSLKLFAVEESFLLQNAAALYHQAHPEVLIELEFAYSYDDKYSGKEPDYNEIYQQLNTMLMGEDAPDILVLDHLDMESYAEKGLLVDLQEIMAPLEADGTVLSNITGAYLREDGTRYTVPAEFGYTFVMGREIAEEDMASLKSLAGFLQGTSENYLGEQTVAELVDKFYPYFCEKIIADKALDMEALKENLGYLKNIADNCGIVEVHDDNNGRNGHAYNMWDLASRAKLAFDESEGFNASMFDMALVDFVDGEFTAFENCFTDSCRMSVCSKSEYQETAMDFVRFVLSEEVQGTDYYSGFPVNAACLEKLARADRSDMMAQTTIEVGDGSEEEFSIFAYPQETADRLLAICRQVDRRTMEDEKVREVLAETLEGYLNGSKSMEETVAQIECGLKMYLAE